MIDRGRFLGEGDTSILRTLFIGIMTSLPSIWNIRLLFWDISRIAWPIDEVSSACTGSKVNRIDSPSIKSILQNLLSSLLIFISFCNESLECRVSRLSILRSRLLRRTGANQCRQGYVGQEATAGRQGSRVNFFSLPRRSSLAYGVYSSILCLVLK